jgi:hypothetical protein
MLMWPSSSGCSAIRACVMPWRAAMSIVARIESIMSCIATPLASVGAAPVAAAADAEAEAALSPTAAPGSALASEPAAVELVCDSAPTSAPGWLAAPSSAI